MKAERERIVGRDGNAARRGNEPSEAPFPARFFSSRLFAIEFIALYDHIARTRIRLCNLVPFLRIRKKILWNMQNLQQIKLNSIPIAHAIERKYVLLSCCSSNSIISLRLSSWSAND